jgi:hypothetical protein
MSKFRLYWAFYKSTLIISVVTSCIAAAILLYGEPGYSYLDNLALCNITAGPFCAFMYKEIANPGEYYFYCNRAISKIEVIVSCMVFSIPVSALIYTISVIL